MLFRSLLRKDEGEETFNNSAEIVGYQNFESNPKTIIRNQLKPKLNQTARPKVEVQESAVVMNLNDGEALSEEEHRRILNDNIIENHDKSASCKICGKIFQATPSNPHSAKGIARRHVEVHIEGLSYSCSQCGKTFRSKNAFTIHGSRYHK